MATRGKSQGSKSRQLAELPKELPLSFLKDITKNFADERKVGTSPFGTFYKGILEDGGVIAVKKLQENAPLPVGKAFHKEVQYIMALKHENIVELIGSCSEMQRKLVQIDGRYVSEEITENFLCYEYLPNGSLEDLLFGTDTNKQSIDWDTRFKIIIGICHGLHFLHKLDIPIIHMDLKPESILLDENMVPKIGNFGLSRIFGQEQTRMNTQTVVGSYGYMAPEYLYRGEISAQSDVYSLGLMIIEITTREKNCPEDNEPSARPYIDKVHRDWRLEHISSKYETLPAEGLQQVYACIQIGLECVEIERRNRPSIEKIVDMLNALR